MMIEQLDYEYPVPEEEPRRLRVLRGYRVLDTLPDLEFDAVTRIAAHALHVPSAVVGLMDRDRLWFKSRLGLDQPQQARQIAFCAHTIMHPDQLLVVEDLSQDARFCDSPLVTGAAGLRFYAGAPLTNEEGLVLGTLAVVDTRPRSFSPQDRVCLHDLACATMSLLEGRRRMLEMERFALTDPLTGLGNRAQFETALAREMAHAVRHRHPFTLMQLDLDGFRVVNDTYGHPIGDDVLHELGERLLQIVRTEDMVFRTGGDEFAIIMRSANPSLAAMVEERIRASFETPIRLDDGAEVRVGITVGMAAPVEGETSVQSLMARVDKALSSDKHTRRKWRH